MGTLMYKNQKINSANHDGIIVPSATASIGDTSITIEDASIKTTSYIRIFPNTQSGKTPKIKNYTISNGAITIDFVKLTEAAEFRLRINNY